MSNFTLSDANIQNIEVFKKLLNKDENTIINEALNLYFEQESEKLQDSNNSQTNLSYNEFWDGVDL